MPKDVIMDKKHIEETKKLWKLANLRIKDNFHTEWDAIYVIRADSQDSPIKQCKCRAKNLALVLSVSLLDLRDMISRMELK